MSTYLELTNRAIRRFNEVQLTSVNFSAAVGFQAFVKDAINDAVNDIIQEELEWPFNVATNTETLTRGIAEYSLASGFRTIDWESFFITNPDLITNGTFASAITSWTDSSTGTGTIAHTTDGNGRMRVAGGASGVGIGEQSITTIANTVYRITFRVFTGTVTLRIGTASAGTEILSEAFVVTNTGEGTYYSTNFTATTASTFIGFTNAANANIDVDTVAVVDASQAEYLQLRDIDHYNMYFRTLDYILDPSRFATPTFVFPTLDDKFIVSAPPNKEYQLEYKYHSVPTAMSSDTDTITIPVRYEHVIIDRAMFYIFMFREDAESATIMDSRSMKKIDRMRIELINKSTRMYSGPSWQKEQIHFVA